MYRTFHQAEGATGCGPAFDKRSFGRHNMHRGFHPHIDAMRKAPVSIYKTETTYEIMVFAPGRNKELFNIAVKGDEITVSYTPAESTAGLDWIRKEYSRGGFERNFMVDETIDKEHIVAKYEDGVLRISLSIKEGSIQAKQDIKIS